MIDSKKSLLIVNSTFPIELRGNFLIPRDGFSVHSVGLATHLQDSYRITILSPGLSSSFDYQGITIINWGGQGRSTKKVGSLDYWRKVMQEMFSDSYDLIMVHSGVTLFLSLISDIIPAHCLGVIHDTHSQQQRSYLKLGREIWLRNSKGLDLLFTVNSYGLQDLIEKYKYPRHKVHFVGNGVDIGLYTFSSAKEDRIVFIGRFVPSKRVAELVQALQPWLQENKNAKLVLIGSGFLYDELRSYVAANQLADNIEILVGLNDEKKIAELRRAKIYASLSVVEGFGIPLVEGMACGAVPVVSDINAHRFVFQDKDVGFLVKDAREFVTKIDFLMKNEESRREMAARGRKLAEDMWTLDRVRERYEVALSHLGAKKLSLFARKIKRPVKKGVLKFLFSLAYFFLFRINVFRFANDGR